MYIQCTFLYTQIYYDFVMWESGIKVLKTHVLSDLIIILKINPAIHNVQVLVYMCTYVLLST